jgi:uncharacterized protein (DUF885 family)
MTSIAELSEELLAVLLESSPIDASVMGIPGYDSVLPDLSVEAERLTQQRLEDLLSRLDALALESSRENQLEVEIVRDFTVGAMTRLSAATIELAATDYLGAPLGGLLLFVPQIVLSTPERALAYLDRLRAVPRFLEGLAGRLTAGTAAGRTAVAHLTERNIAQVDRYLGDPDHDPLLRLAPPEGWDGAGDFEAERRRILAEIVRPAFLAYRAVLTSVVLPAGRPFDRVGLVWIPDGEATYEALTRYHTTTSVSPRQIHQLGLDVIDGLRQEYADIGERVFGTRDVPEIHRLMRADPALRFRDEEEILTLAEAAIRRAEEASPAWFGRLPVQRCVVAPVPKDQASSAPAAYYFPPALDGSRPGTYYANTTDPGERSRFEAEAIAFHEGVPGHHFQLALMQEVELSRLRQIYGVTAYAEGWGLYAERLADEMGLYSDDVTLLGMLSADSMRAARLVVDTGLHVLGWSREQAVAYCRDNTPMAPADIEVEIDRYISDPGQALAYMMGRLEIQRVRALAEARLGEAFDIKGFHDAVLAVGGVPLGLLERVVTAWCETIELP